MSFNESSPIPRSSRRSGEAPCSFPPSGLVSATERAQAMHSLISSYTLDRALYSSSLSSLGARPRRSRFATYMRRFCGKFFESPLFASLLFTILVLALCLRRVLIISATSWP